MKMKLQNSNDYVFKEYFIRLKKVITKKYIACNSMKAALRSDSVGSLVSTLINYT